MSQKIYLSSSHYLMKRLRWYMMPVDFGNLFSTKLFALESYHDTILCNKHPVYYESATNTYFSV